MQWGLIQEISKKELHWPQLQAGSGLVPRTQYGLL